MRHRYFQIPFTVTLAALGLALLLFCVEALQAGAEGPGQSSARTAKLSFGNSNVDWIEDCGTHTTA